MKLLKTVRRTLAEAKEDLVLAGKARRYAKLDLQGQRALLEKLYSERSNRPLHLDAPVRLTEKIQWRKIYDESPVYTMLSDKYACRAWVEKKIGKEYLVPLLGVWDKFEDINPSALPEQFVLKTNNGCRTNLVVTDRSELDWDKAQKSFQKWLKMPFWCFNYEPHYRAIEPKIIAEEFLPSNMESGLTDYKFYCFSGAPVFCQVITGRTSTECIDFFDMEWKHCSFVGLNPKCKNAPLPIPKPEQFEELKEVARKLSEGFAFVRVDLYNTNGKVYFGEMTFTPSGGYGGFNPDEWDERLGNLWDLTIPQVGEAAEIK